MIKEQVLNSFLSSNLKALGLHHVNSEVPKVVTQHVGKRTDILAFDINTRIPIVIELKVRKDPGVIHQLQDYIRLILRKYPNLFEELNAFRKITGFEFNYVRGIVGLVLSPEPAPASIQDNNITVLWAQYSKSKLDDHRIIQIIDRKTLSLSNEMPLELKKRPPYNDLRIEQFVAASNPNLRKFVDRLDKMYLSVSETIYPRPKLDYNYSAYYGTDTERNAAVFGFGTGNDRSQFDVTFHIKVNNHHEFIELDATKKLPSLGLRLGQPRKDLIFPIRIEERFASNDSQVSDALNLFKQLAIYAHEHAKVPELDKFTIDPSSHNALSLDNIFHD